MVGLEILKYTYDLSDEELVARWFENPYWQYFCGEVYFQTEFPLHSTSLGKWHRRVGAEKLKVIIEETIRIAKEQKFTTKKDLSCVIVDTTVQEKNITFPTDSKLILRAIIKLGKQALKYKIKLRRSHSRVAKQKAQQASGYASYHQYGRLNKSKRTMTNWLGCLLRDLERKLGNKPISANFATLIRLSKKLLVQDRNSKNKIYSLHEPEVQCISKGKTRIPYDLRSMAIFLKPHNININFHIKYNFYKNGV
jgi:IS5 family transposase